MHVWPVGGIDGRVATVTDIHRGIVVFAHWEQRDVHGRIIHIVSTAALSSRQTPLWQPTDLCFSLLSSELPFQSHRQKLNPSVLNSTLSSAYRDWSSHQVCLGYFNAPTFTKKSVCICVHWNKRKRSRTPTTNGFPPWELIKRDGASWIWSRECWVTSAEVSPEAPCSATVCVKSVAWWYDKDGTFRQHLHSLPLAFVGIHGSTLSLKEMPGRRSQAPFPQVSLLRSARLLLFAEPWLLLQTVGSCPLQITAKWLE